MTEAEWLTATGPHMMLRFLRGNTSDRKLRLFACACVRTVWSHLKDSRSRAAVELAERHADEGVPLEMRQNAINAAYEAAYGRRTWAADGAISTLQKETLPASRCAPRRTRMHLIRDIFGNPFRTVTVDASWLTSDVVALVQGIYQNRAFDRMPILADALQDAGCENDTILDHCRDEKQVHVRGCWVVDLVLGKS